LRIRWTSAPRGIWRCYENHRNTDLRLAYRRPD
jgi:hypothetical protein